MSFGNIFDWWYKEKIDIIKDLMPIIDLIKFINKNWNLI